MTQKSSEKDVKYKSYAIVSMVGDFIHNFSDGLSIGVSYVADYKMGLITTLAMFMHEIPHEVADFAILYQLNYSLCQIVGLQCLTALGAVAGSTFGNIVGQLYLNECLAFTTGGFLYFSINNLMGEIKEIQSFPMLILCLLCSYAGIQCMYLMVLLN